MNRACLIAYFGSRFSSPRNGNTASDAGEAMRRPVVACPAGEAVRVFVVMVNFGEGPSPLIVDRVLPLHCDKSGQRDPYRRRWHVRFLSLYY